MLLFLRQAPAQLSLAQLLQLQVLAMFSLLVGFGKLFGLQSKVSHFSDLSQNLTFCSTLMWVLQGIQVFVSIDSKSGG